ncbi:FBLN1 isoform 2, partial [Pongo abelii]
DITEGNLRDSFDIIKRYMDGMTVAPLLNCHILKDLQTWEMKTVASAILDLDLYSEHFQSS